MVPFRLVLFRQGCRVWGSTLIAAWVALAAPLAARNLQNVEYAAPAGRSLTMDGYVPDGTGPYPAAILVHGGAWVKGDKGSIRPLFAPLEQAGFAWFSIDYRLADLSDVSKLLSPDGVKTVTGASDDVRAAVAYIKNAAAELHVDPNRIVLIGESAGAQLAEVAALMPAEGGDVAGLVGFFGPSDLGELAQTSDRVPPQLRQALTGSTLGQMLLAGLQTLSPRYMVGTVAPPFLLFHGTEDPLVPLAQSEEMCDAMHQANQTCDLVTVNGGGHGLRWWDRNASLASYKDRLVAWLQQFLK